MAETTNSSMPLPGAQVLMSSRLSAFVTRISTKPASAGQTSVSCAVAAPATAQQGRIILQLRGQRRLVDDIRDRETPARLQRAERLAKNLRLVRHQINDAVREDHVGGVVGDGQMLELTQSELDIARVDPGRVLSRFLEHLVRHVDANHMARHADLAGGEKAVEAGAAAEIDDGLAGLQGRYRLRVAAAETEVGPVRYGGELGVRITHLTGFAVGIGARAAAA